MALFNRSIGSRIFTSIGRKGEQPDVRPALIAGPVTLHFVNGRPTEFVNVIELAENRDGDKYLRERLANVQYSWDRTELVAELDGTETAPKTITEVFADRMAALEQYRASQAQEVDVADLA